MTEVARHTIRSIGVPLLPLALPTLPALALAMSSTVPSIRALPLPLPLVPSTARSAAASAASAELALPVCAVATAATSEKSANLMIDMVMVLVEACIDAGAHDHDQHRVKYAVL